MAKWIFRLVLLGVVGFVGLALFDSYRGGYFQIPDLKPNEYPVSFKAGLRAIVIDPEVTNSSYAEAPKFFRRLANANDERVYIGVAMNVAHWLEDVWSYCPAPTDEERNGYRASLPEDWKDALKFARLEGVCWIDVEGEKVLRGLVYSRPAM